MEYRIEYRCRVCDKLIYGDTIVTEDLIDKIKSGEAVLKHMTDTLQGSYWSITVDGQTYEVRDEIDHVEDDHYGIADFAGFD